MDVTIYVLFRLSTTIRLENQLIRRSHCTISNSVAMETPNSDFSYEHRIISIAALCVGVSLFLPAVVIVPATKLHKLLVYRLALYQVVSAKFLLVAWVMRYLVTFYTDTSNHQALKSIDTLVGVAVMLKVMLTAWISLHLFLLSVFHKNMKRFEPLYLVSSIIAALTVLIVGLVNALHKDDSMNTNYTTIAFVNKSDNSLGGFLGGQTILTSIGAVVLLLTSVLVVAMGIILCCRAYRRKNGIVSHPDKQHKKVLYEMMPLFVYPILLTLLFIPVMVLSYYDVLKYTSGNSKTFSTFRAVDNIVSTVMVSFASCACSCALIIHVLVVLCIKNRKKSRIHFNNSANGERNTINVTTNRYTRSDTHFLLPLED